MSGTSLFIVPADQAEAWRVALGEAYFCTVSIENLAAGETTVFDVQDHEGGVTFVEWAMQRGLEFGAWVHANVNFDKSGVVWAYELEQWFATAYVASEYHAPVTSMRTQLECSDGRITKVTCVEHLDDAMCGSIFNAIIALIREDNSDAEVPERVRPPVDGAVDIAAGLELNPREFLDVDVRSAARVVEIKTERAHAHGQDDDPDGVTVEWSGYFTMTTGRRQLASGTGYGRSRGGAVWEAVARALAAAREIMRKTAAAEMAARP